MLETLLVIYTDGQAKAVSVIPSHTPEAARDLLLDRTVAAVIHLTRLHHCPQDPPNRDLPLHRGEGLGALGGDVSTNFSPSFH